MIDPRAIIDPSAVIGEAVVIGAWSTVGPGAAVGDACRIAPHVVVGAAVQLGCRNRVAEFSAIGAGAAPDRAPVLGDDNIVREGVVIDAGCVAIGSGNVILPQAFIAAGTRIGDGVEVAPRSCVETDCPSFVCMRGSPAQPVALHHAGLAALGADAEVVEALETVFRRMVDEGRPVAEARGEVPAHVIERDVVVDFISGLEKISG